MAADALLPHHRRGALIIARPELDLLDVACAIAEDQSERIAELLADGRLYKSDLGELADWCADRELRVQFVILQPYVLAQRILEDEGKVAAASDPTLC